MEKMNKSSLATLLLCVTIFLFSCSKELTRDKASILIKQLYKYPNVVTSILDLEKNKDSPFLQNGVNTGLIRISFDAYAQAFHGNGNIYNFTEKGKPFIIEKWMGMHGDGGAEIITNCRDFFEVTGIKNNEQEKSAIVMFSCKRKGITPFGKILGYNEGDIENFTMSMTLFDDGWRTVGEIGQIIKPETYPFFTKDGEYKSNESSESEKIIKKEDSDLQTANAGVSATIKEYSGNVGKLATSYNLTWNLDGTIEGSYYYLNKPNIKYTLKGEDLGNGNIQLTEYTESNISANCKLTLEANCYVGRMNNTDGRILKMTMCQ